MTWTNCTSDSVNHVIKNRANFDELIEEEEKEEEEEIFIQP